MIKVTVEIDGETFSATDWDQGENSPWGEHLRLFFKAMKKHDFIFRVKPKILADGFSDYYRQDIMGVSSEW